MKHLILSAFLLAGSLIPPVAYSLDNDIAQQAKISANNQNFNFGKNIAIYKGNVQISQGSIKIKADYLKIYNHGIRGNEMMVFTGQPAQFSQVMDDGQHISAQADSIRFERSSNLIKLTSNVSVNWGGNVVAGDSIEYDIETRELNADGNSQLNKQVTTILKPKSDNK